MSEPAARPGEPTRASEDGPTAAPDEVTGSAGATRLPDDDPTPDTTRVLQEDPTPDTTRLPDDDPTPGHTRLPDDDPTPDHTRSADADPAGRTPVPAHDGEARPDADPDTRPLPDGDPTPGDTRRPDEDPTPGATRRPDGDPTPGATRWPDEDPTPGATRWPDEHPTTAAAAAAQDSTVHPEPAGYATPAGRDTTGYEDPAARDTTGYTTPTEHDTTGYAEEPAAGWRTAAPAAGGAAGSTTWHLPAEAPASVPDGSTAPPYSTERVAFRRPDPLAALLLVLAGVVAAVSLLPTWLPGRDTGLQLVRTGIDDVGQSLDRVRESGSWQPVVIVLGGGVLLLLGLLMLLPARKHRALGVLALLVTAAVTTAVLIPLAAESWDLGRFDIGFYLALAVAGLGLLGALKALLTGPRYGTRAPGS